MDQRVLRRNSAEDLHTPRHSAGLSLFKLMSLSSESSKDDCCVQVTAADARDKIPNNILSNSTRGKNDPSAQTTNELRLSSLTQNVDNLVPV